MIKFPSWFDRRIVAYEIIAFLVIVALSFQLVVINYGYIDDDEIEHLHSSWLVYKGNVPYKDFFEHHNPLLWYLLSSLFMIFTDDIGVVSAGRGIMFAFNLMILVVSYKIAREYFNKVISSLAVVAILFEYNYMISAELIRPDIAMTLLWLVAFYLFLRSMKSNYPKKYLFLSGILIGVAFTFKQMALFFLLALIMSVIVQNLYKQRTDKQIMFKHVLLLLMGSIIPIALLFTYFYFNNALNDFVYWTFIFNLEHNIGNILLRSAQVLSGFLNDIPFWALGLAGVITATISLLKERLPDNEVPLLISIYIVALSLIPSDVMWYYRYMPLTPLVAIYVIFVIKNVIIDRGIEYLKGSHEKKLIIFTFLILLLFGLMHPLSFLVSWKIENCGLSQLILENRTKQDDTMKFVWRLTSPGDAVFDGYGLYISRNHSYKYWFMHESLFDLSSLKNIPEYLNKTQTKVVIYDSRVEQLSNEVQEFIKRHYVPTGKHDVYVVGATLTKDDLQDGSGSFYLLSSGNYEVLMNGTYEIYIDDKPINNTLYLTRGQHGIYVDSYNGYMGIVTIRYHYEN